MKFALAALITLSLAIALFEVGPLRKYMPRCETVTFGFCLKRIG